IAGWPDGTASFTDYLDSDGIERADVRITATVTIEGDELTADLTDCAPMVRGSLNSTRSFIQACVYQAIRCALTVEIPNTSGAFLFAGLIVGTWGGTPEADGNDGLTNPASLAANIPVEVAEAEFPIRVERYGLVPDSGGAGEHRGGLAVERVWRCLTPDTSLIVRSDRAVHAPYGLQSGRPGALSSNLLIRADGTEEVLPSMFSITIQPGDVYVHRTAGGGGWGDPAKRDPQQIADDLADGKVTHWTP